MMNFVFGVIIAVLLICFHAEIRTFAVDTGIRDKVVQNLKSW